MSYSTTKFIQNNLYSACKNASFDTSLIEPIEENREDLIKSILYMAKNIATKTSLTFGLDSNELFQVAAMAATMAVDIYIDRATKAEHTAKLSTVAYPYIKKYVNEYRLGNLSMLSYNVSSWYAANQTKVQSGDRKAYDDNESTVFDGVSSKIESNYMDKDTSDKMNTLKNKLFSVLTDQQRLIVCLTYGINAEEKRYELSEIAPIVGYSASYVHKQLNNSIYLLKEYALANPDEMQDLLEILSNNKNKLDCKF